MRKQVLNDEIHNKQRIKTKKYTEFLAREKFGKPEIADIINILYAYYTEYDERGNVIYQKETWKNGEDEYRYEHIYNDNNLIIEQKTYSPQTDLEKVRFYKYNENGKIVEIKEYDKDGFILKKTKHEYLDNNKISSIVTYEPDGKENKNERKCYYYYEDYYLLEYYQFDNKNHKKYDYNDFLIENKNGECLEYDFNGNILRVFQTSNNIETNIRLYKYEYDKNGLILKKTEIDNETMVVENEYNEFGDLIKSIHFRNDLPYEIDILEYTYY